MMVILLQGRRMNAELYRNGSLVTVFADDDPFIYESPKMHFYDDSPIAVYPGTKTE